MTDSVTPDTLTAKVEQALTDDVLFRYREPLTLHESIMAALTPHLQAAEDQLTAWILIADGAKHDPRCAEHFAGELDRPRCLRCRLEAAEAREAAYAEWQKSVSAAIQTIPEFHSGKWGGEKSGWGWHLEIVRFCQREREKAEADNRRLTEALTAAEQHDCDRANMDRLGCFDCNAADSSLDFETYLRGCADGKKSADVALAQALKQSEARGAKLNDYAQSLIALGVPVTAPIVYDPTAARPKLCVRDLLLPPAPSVLPDTVCGKPNPNVPDGWWSEPCGLRDGHKMACAFMLHRGVAASVSREGQE